MAIKGLDLSGLISLWLQHPDRLDPEMGFNKRDSDRGWHGQGPATRLLSRIGGMPRNWRRCSRVRVALGETSSSSTGEATMPPLPLKPDTRTRRTWAIASSLRWLLCRRKGGSQQLSCDGVSGCPGVREVRGEVWTGKRGQVLPCPEPVRPCPRRTAIDSWLAAPNGIECSGGMCVSGAATRGQKGYAGSTSVVNHLCMCPEPVRSLTQRPAASTGSGAPRGGRRSPGASCRH